MKGLDNYFARQLDEYQDTTMDAYDMRRFVEGALRSYDEPLPYVDDVVVELMDEYEYDPEIDLEDRLDEYINHYRKEIV